MLRVSVLKSLIARAEPLPRDFFFSVSSASLAERCSALRRCDRLPHQELPHFQYRSAEHCSACPSAQFGSFSSHVFGSRNRALLDDDSSGNWQSFAFTGLFSM